MNPPQNSYSRHLENQLADTKFPTRPQNQCKNSPTKFQTPTLSRTYLESRGSCFQVQVQPQVRTENGSETLPAAVFRQTNSNNFNSYCIQQLPREFSDELHHSNHQNNYPNHYSSFRQNYSGGQIWPICSTCFNLLTSTCLHTMSICQNLGSAYLAKSTCLQVTTCGYHRFSRMLSLRTYLFFSSYLKGS